MADFPRNGFIPLPYHHVMLTDEARLNAFSRAIANLVTQDDVVLEVGGGTGILSMLAAQRAKRVYTVEYSPENAAACAQFVALNGLEDRIQVVCADAREWTPPEPVQVVICEMLHVGLVNEQQVPVLNHLHRHLGNFRAIPLGVVNAIEPVDVDFRVRGFDLPFIRYQPFGVEDPTVTSLVSEPAVYGELDFYGPVAERVDACVPLSISRTGRCNAVRLTTVAVVDGRPDEAGGLNQWALQRLIVPLQAPVALEEGDSLDLHLQYAMGCELDEIRVAIAQNVNK